MYSTRKLKPPILSTEGIIGIIATSCFLFLLIFSFRLAMGFGVLITSFAAILSLIIMIRTHNVYFIVSFLAQLLATAFLLTIAIFGIEEIKPFLVAIAGLMVVSMTMMLIFIFQKKMKWRTREVMEMAAQPVDDIKDGFTSRPLQAARADYAVDELRDFASFISKSMIAIPIHEASRTIFVVNIPLGRLLFFNKDYRDRSWVSFDHEGNISASISQVDYFQYRDDLAFDQLCDSLGKLFYKFFEDYRAGKGQRVIDRFNAMKLNIITEG